MIKSCVTIALVPQIKSGPWIYWEDLEAGMEKASKLGFDAIELFTPAADAIEIPRLKALLANHKLELAAVGTGAGKVIHGLTLTDPDPAIRANAISFIKDMMDFGAVFGAPAIIGSMQGNVLPGNDREETMSWLAEALNQLGKHAESMGVILIYEPLNRYETNLLNTIEAGSKFLDTLETKSVKLLADLFHMNIEEGNLEESILNWGKYIGHVHFADSNRRPMGFGHTSMQEIASALKTIGYTGYASAEAFPYPDPDAAAEQTIEEFGKWFR
ncbi:sugar phosphate isomerase/epimerase [Algoriphagus ratkowskyi]|uniref:Sugar phosphate isomerase/epimerase n=1 Tax=Algoriphagus ratkowskyi TaxID=57028 RepID=A0A2W7R6M3_9BACT|nr:sugar phosphate isomerase/epimerase family protein [Algoriphagus ratkowskyi]PZX53980.1 sugar phosphate isomerase/epimerase [Algoriphagus ratkowskyi]TXD76621.1 sugar phosphate isomerase/epimerase [Algoriphagus ratkowskyi]